MRSIYRHLVRPLLFQQDSEIAHERTLTALSWASRNRTACEALSSLFESPDLPVRVFGLLFPNPVGLAAGMDKYATAVPAWESLGFGFAELGGVTGLAQEGNPAPRLFRVVASGALINRMGFNNPGAEAFAERLSEWRNQGRWPSHPIGINIGRSKVTPLEHAAEDYAKSFGALWPHADFFVINVSSPNTPNLRDLQVPSALDEVLAAVQEVNQEQAASKSRRAAQQQIKPHASSARDASHPKPVLIKIAPELSFPEIDDVLKVTFKREIAGIVATNTTVERPDSEDPKMARLYAEAGGLSGRPLRARSTEVIRHIFRQSCGRLPIIGVGGVFNASDAWEKIMAGASLVQTYTGLVYEGPGVAKHIVLGLRELLAERGLDRLSDAVGIAAGTP